MSLYGLHRVMENENKFPQAAARLDNSMQPQADEVLLDVQMLNIDSSSFRQLKAAHNNDEQKIAAAILDIVQSRGKMHNPVTNSGGMLIGNVIAVGDDIDSEVKPGDNIATLVSLTLTPLQIDEIISVSHNEAQLQVKGKALLFKDSPFAHIPADLNHKIVLSALDVCGAPRLMQVHVKQKDEILILGGGTSGILSAIAALDKGNTTVTILEKNAQRIEKINSLNLPFTVVQCDVSFIKEYIGYANRFNLIFDCTNIPDVEMTSIICARHDGKILYFNTATSFTQAALGAEGIGKQVTMIIGNGFYPNHAAYTLDLLRKYPKVQTLLQ